MRIVILLFGMFCLYGCASVHKEIPAHRVTSYNLKSPLKISAEVNNRLSSEYFGMVEFTIENSSDKWIEIEQFKVKPGKTENNNVLFTVGKDFEIWSKAIVTRNKIEDFNTAFAYSAIILGAASVSTLAGSESISDSAGIIGGMTAISMGAEAINELRSRAEGTNIIPEGNLLRKNIRVPPGLFVNAWLLLNTRDHENNPPITELVLQAKYKEGKKESFRVPLYKKYPDLGRYRWQSISQKYLKKELSIKNTSKN